MDNCPIATQFTDSIVLYQQSMVLNYDNISAFMHFLYFHHYIVIKNTTPGHGGSVSDLKMLCRVCRSAAVEQCMGVVSKVYGTTNNVGWSCLCLCCWSLSLAPDARQILLMPDNKLLCKVLKPMKTLD